MIFCKVCMMMSSIFLRSSADSPMNLRCGILAVMLSLLFFVRASPFHICAFIGNCLGSFSPFLTPANLYTFAHAIRLMRGVIVGCVVIVPPSLCMPAYGTGLVIRT